jgi:integrase
MALTQKGTRGLLTRGEVGRHFDRDGLYLIISSPTAANWERRYQVRGKARAMGLGSVKAFDLEQARSRNKEISRQLADGTDPVAARRTKREAERAAAAMPVKLVTFSEVAERYIGDKQAGWKSPVHGRQWQRSLKRYAFPIIGHLDIRAIGMPEVLAVLEQRLTLDDGTSGKFWELRVVTADRIRNRIELILNYSMARGHREHGFNPAGWDRLKHVLPAKRKVAQVQHVASVPYGEVPGVMADLRPREGVAAQALMFTILTACRTNEVLGAVWDEIDLANKVWTIPAPRMKSGKEHRVPLSDVAVALLQSLYTEQNNPYIFIGGRNARLSTRAMVAVLRRIGRSESVHGFRSSFANWAHERTSHGNHTIEISLAHAVGSEVEKAYRRTDLFGKRAKLMGDWAEFVTTAAPKQAAVGNVVTFGGAR